MENNYQLHHKIKIAKQYEEQGKHLHAIQIYQNLIDENTVFAEVYLNLSHLYENTNRIEPAIDLLKSYIEKYPDSKDIRLALSQLYLRNSRWNEAIEMLNNLPDTDEPIAVFFLGYAHYMLKEFELAKIYFLKFSELDEKTELRHEAYIYLAKIEIELKNYEKAVNYAKKAEVIYSNFWELNLIFSIAYYHLGMYAHALLPVEKAIKINPREAAAYEWAGKIYLKLGDYLKAEKNFLKYIESVEEASSDTYTKLAEACLMVKKAKAALDYFDIAIKLDPKNNFAIEGKKNASSLLNGNKVSDG
ncbi:MAG TPA: tetratricopeptide repeat protein [Ignavibacteriaceae bacterium]|nr:tetratricopeptide repeat protein [Ignavibacteriaceae bacterium]